MAVRVPRLVLIAAVALLATAGLTFAARSSLVQTSPTAASEPLVQKRATLLVPDVRNQAFVFAKGALQDAGFSWRVAGPVHGYSANTVVAQTPAPGIRVYDTGAPVITLTLVRNKNYPQRGTPEDISPYRHTQLAVADGSALVQTAPAAATPAATPAATSPAATTPAATTPAATTPSASAAPAVHAPTSHPAAAAAATRRRARPAPTRAAAATKQAAATKPAATTHPAVSTSAPGQARPSAFVVAGAPKEPLDEVSLPARAHALNRWLTAHPHPTSANVRHWLYQHQWVVTGARFGWWHGAEALRTLIRVDRRVESLWGVGSKSEGVAAGALSEVEARSK
jgi:PASTA domain